MLHILPETDEKPHVEDGACWCEPEIKLARDETAVVHRSKDEREGRNGNIRWVMKELKDDRE